MKLNRSEIKALAIRLSVEIANAKQTKKEELVKNYKPSKSTESLYKKIDEFSKLSKTVEKLTGIGLIHPYTLERIKENIRNKELGINDLRIDYTTIEDDITIAQIECTNLDNIIQVIKDKYIK